MILFSTNTKMTLKKTWFTLNEILNKTTKKKSFPEFFRADGQPIHNKIFIAEKFNIFFTNIGSNLANQINKPNNINFKQYLTKKHHHNLTFEEVSEETEKKY